MRIASGSGMPTTFIKTGIISIQQGRASGKTGAVEHHAHAVMHLVLHLAHAEARTFRQTGAAGGIRDDAKTVGTNAFVGQFHQRRRQVLVVADHFHGQVVVGQRYFQQARFAPGSFAHRGRLRAPDVDDVAQPAFNGRRDLLLFGRAVTGRGDNAQFDARRLVSASAPGSSGA